MFTPQAEFPILSWTVRSVECTSVPFSRTSCSIQQVSGSFALLGQRLTSKTEIRIASSCTAAEFMAFANMQPSVAPRREKTSAPHHTVGSSIFSAFSNFAKDVTTASQEALSNFQLPDPLPDGGPRASPKRLRVEGDGGVDQVNPFNDDQYNWLSNTMSQQQELMAKQCDVRFKKIEQVVSYHDGYIAKNTVDMEQLQAIVQQQQDDIKQLKQLYENVQKDQSTANQSIVEIQTTQKDITSSTAGPAPLPAVPVELRTTFAMGNLGPPAEAEEIETRARKVLSDMRAQGVEGLRAYRRRNGNVCEVIVNYPANGAIIKTKVFNSRLNLGLAIGKSVWFDVAKTRDEMRPAILTHRGAAQLEALECSREDKIEVKKTIGSRQVHLGLMLAGWVSAGQWEWANFAKSRYNAEELQSSKDSINSF